MDLFQFVPGMCVESHHRPGPTTIKATGATVLYVTELVNDLDEALPIDSDLGENRSRHLRLVHVVNLAHTPSSPDASKGFQYGLDALAAKLRKLKWDVVTMLLFGCAEDKTPKRARQVKATLIAFRSSSVASAESEEGLCTAMKRKAGCPVVVLRRQSK